MRFGISLISWMLPKILRMRRELMERLEEGRAWIALVAMMFPALGRAPKCPTCVPAEAGTRTGLLLAQEHEIAERGSCRPLPMRSARARFRPCPGKAGKAPGARHRAAEPSNVGC